MEYMPPKMLLLAGELRDDPKRLIPEVILSNMGLNLGGVVKWLMLLTGKLFGLQSSLSFLKNGIDIPNMPPVFTTGSSSTSIAGNFLMV
jgi:hypothetical protein